MISEYQVLLQKESEEGKCFISVFTNAMRIIELRKETTDKGISEFTGIPLPTVRDHTQGKIKKPNRTYLEYLERVLETALKQVRRLLKSAL